MAPAKVAATVEIRTSRFLTWESPALSLRSAHASSRSTMPLSPPPPRASGFARGERISMGVPMKYSPGM